MGVLFATGFEMGSLDVVNQGTCTLETSQVHTGSYSLKFDGHVDWFKVGLVEHSLSEVYIAFWLYVTDTALALEIKLYMTDGKVTRLYTDASSKCLDCSRDGTTIAEGSQPLHTGWNHVQWRLKVDNTSGVCQTKINGVDDIDFSGDTQPGSSSIIDYWINDPWENYTYYWDDIAIRDDTWPGDVRLVALFPDGDDTATWDRSGGSTNYENVDEAPPSDSDYVYTSTTGEKEKYTLGDFDTAERTPLFVIDWARVKKDEASAHQIKLVLDDGTESVSNAMDLDTTFEYLYRILETKPSGGAWDDTALDALKVGQESVIV